MSDEPKSPSPTPPKRGPATSTPGQEALEEVALILGRAHTGLTGCASRRRCSAMLIAARLHDAWSKSATRPSDQVVVIFVRGISESFEQIRVTADPPQSSGGQAFSPSRQTHCLRPDGRRTLLDDDRVMPRVSEVVFIGEAHVRADGLEHRHVLLIDLVFRIVAEVYAETLAADNEATKVRIRPAHRFLEDVVKLGETDARARADDARPRE